ncbi:MAG TPA: lauroyl acyltransferase [Stellaceae bacterium]|nr:lauroyl acyltransferase [Stellaceae bacterium]
MSEHRPWLRRVLHYLEGVAVALAFALIGILPLDVASWIGGTIARIIGPALAVTKRARANLRRAFPGIGDQEVDTIIRGMWDNIGRVTAEYPHLGKFDLYQPGGRVEVHGVAPVVAGHRTGQRYIFFSGHFGNWEVGTLASTQTGMKAIEIYRAANNPIVDRIIIKARTAMGRRLAPKGPLAARALIAAPQQGLNLGMLVDQKMNDGIPVPFFGRDAMTAPALARLALKYGYLPVPFRVERVRGAHFRLIAEPPMTLPKSGDLQADTLALMTEVNRVLERWIRERPDHWFWIHRRWPD